MRGGGFGNDPPAVKEWGDAYPATAGIHWPVAVEHAGDGVEKPYAFALGLEEVGDGASQIVLKRYRTDVVGMPQATKAVWPKRAEGIYRPVDMFVRQSWGQQGGPPGIDIYVLAQVEKGDGMVRTVTIAFTEDADGGMVVDWTREFERTNDETGDNIPIGISAAGGLVSVLIAQYMESNTRVTYGLNVYHANDGMQYITPANLSLLPGDHHPVGILMPDGASVFLTGYTTDVQGVSHLLTVAYDLNGESENFGSFLREFDGNVELACWDPFFCGEAEFDKHIRFALPGYHVTPVRLIKKHASEMRLHIAGNAKSTTTGQESMVAVTFESYRTAEGGRYISWADRYDGDGIEVARDITAATTVTHGSSTPVPGFVWLAGSSYGNLGNARLRVLQYFSGAALEGPTQEFPYHRNHPEWQREGWAALWTNPNGVHAEGFRINHLRDDKGGAPGTVSPMQVYVGMLLQENLLAPWEHGVIKYNADVPTAGSKQPYWQPIEYVTDPGPTGSNEPMVGLDARLVPLANPMPRFWFGAPSLDNGDMQWYTTQWRDEQP